ncbi:MAG: 1-deoxy-D-xylulose-5-phosphate synthase [Eubacteriales bacterium]|nr:1-deoxy-D-xylulose-5-phosphate synthase [Eubacteriales bacterium]
MLLEHINGPEDLKRLTGKQAELLAQEIREFIIEKTSHTGGHLASNLGVVELTIALFRVLNLPEDKIIWDVGHQAYTHKILSGRKDDFDGLRQLGGISGFPKRGESPYDSFDTGHSSTSISAGLGMAQGRDIRGEDYTVVSVIGDGSLTGGMAYEALNNASHIKKNFIIILNDNNMSISKNVGGVSNYLNGLRTAAGYNRFKRVLEEKLRGIPLIGNGIAKRLKRTKDSIKGIVIPGMLFEDMGITYLGPVNGHDIRAVERALRDAKKLDHAVLIHVLTKKGKGYAPAEKAPEKFHGVEPFDIRTGKKLRPASGLTYTQVFSDKLISLAEKNKNIVAVTAAMPDGTGLSRFRDLYPERFFDVGIAEAHAVTSSAGMAAAGLRPVVAVYSSFLQRGFDQIVHDVCLQNLPVVFAVDRSGLVGSDGETHQGIFDLSYLGEIPNMTVMAPKNMWELEEMLEFAFKLNGPSAIRYPRGKAYTGLKEYQAPVEYGKGELLAEGEKIALLALGSMVSTAQHIREKLSAEGYSLTLANARFAKPVDLALVERLAASHGVIITLEENVERGGFGQIVTEYIHAHHPDVRTVNITLPDAYVEHGDVTALRKLLGIDSDSVIEKLRREGVIRPAHKEDRGTGETGKTER